jgi:hypothetical protein
MTDPLAEMTIQRDAWRRDALAADDRIDRLTEQLPAEDMVPLKDLVIVQEVLARKRAEVVSLRAEVKRLVNAVPTDNGATWHGEYTSGDAPRQGCELAPYGWYCSRAVGHDGPCAAHMEEFPVPVLPAEPADAYHDLTTARLLAAELPITCRYHGQNTERVVLGRPAACCDTGYEAWRNKRLRAALIDRLAGGPRR